MEITGHVQNGSQGATPRMHRSASGLTSCRNAKLLPLDDSSQQILGTANCPTNLCVFLARLKPSKKGTKFYVALRGYLPNMYNKVGDSDALEGSPMLALHRWRIDEGRVCAGPELVCLSFSAFYAHKHSCLCADTCRVKPPKFKQLLGPN